MKVALYGTYNNQDTGPSRVTEGLAKGLVANGVEADIISHGDRTDPPEGVGIRHLGETPDNILDFLRTMRGAESGEYDLFHPLEEHYFPSSIRTIQWTSGVYERKKRSPRDFEGYQDLLGDMVLNGINRIAATFSRRVVASSPETARQMKEYWKMSPSDIIPLGIDDSYLQSPTPQGAPLDVLLVGRITQKKGQKDLLQYLETSDKSYEVTVAGSVADEEYYQEIGEWHHRCLGFVRRSRLQELYRESDVVVIPSRHENFSLVALEAIASGSVVVITDCCGFASFRWATPENGIYVASDGEECAHIVKRLSSTDIFEQKEGAYELAKDMTWEKIAEQYIDVYRSL